MQQIIAPWGSQHEAGMQDALIFVFRSLLDLYIISFVLRLALQFVRADVRNPLTQFILRVTNPLVLPLRRVLPPLGGLDTATVLVALALQLLTTAVLLKVACVGSADILQLLGISILQTRPTRSANLSFRYPALCDPQLGGSRRLQPGFAFALNPRRARTGPASAPGAADRRARPVAPVCADRHPGTDHAAAAGAGHVRHYLHLDRSAALDGEGQKPRGEKPQQAISDPGSTQAPMSIASPLAGRRRLVYSDLGTVRSEFLA